jgi:RiboL-PSP-HEPN
MKNREVFRRLKKLKSNFDKAKSLPPDPEVQSHWARYLCILTAGLIEKAVVELLTEYIEAGSSPAIASYAISRLEQLQNPKTRKIAEVLGAFQDTWRVSFEKFVCVDGRKDAIDSVMSNRHRIAHGDDTNITIARVREYFDKWEVTVNYIETLSNP